MNKNKTIDLLNYINKHMTRENICAIYEANNVKYEKCELYSDFVQSLILLCFDTYMGDDITDRKEQINHFRWCWDKNVANFKLEGIHINSWPLYEYFRNFMLEVYYPISKKDDNPIMHENIIKLWNYIFCYSNTKSQSDIDTLLEVYKLFENSIIRY